MEDGVINSANGQCPYFSDCGKLRVMETYASFKLKEFKSERCNGDYEGCSEHQSKSRELTQSPLEAK